MDYELLTGFTPHLLDIVDRDHFFWEREDYTLAKDKTKLNILAYVHSGTGTIELNGQINPLKSGVLFLIQSGSRMKLRTQPRETLNFYSIHYQCTTVKWEGGGARMEDMNRGLPFPQIMDVHKNPQVKELFRDIYQIWRCQEVGYTWRAKLKFLNLLGLLDTVQQAREIDTDHDSQKAIMYVLEYIKNHLNEPMERSFLANLISTSPAYFSVLFKKHTGFTLTHYLLKLRLDRAKNILRSDPMKISDVAKNVGFKDPYYFSRMFRKETGLSPREYRKT